MINGKSMVQQFLILIGLFGVLPAHGQTQNKKSANKPNLIYIMVDDLGYGDVGVFFQNQRKNTNDPSKPYHSTPYLDKMAANGAMFTQQYCNAPVCAPSRASLLAGVNQGNAHVRNNQFDKELADDHTMATVLKQAGYHTLAIGKWGLQGVEETGPYWPAHPLKRGFDYYYGYIRHIDGHEHYPVEALYREKREVYENYKNVADGLAKSFTTDLWTAVAKKEIVDQVKNNDSSKPFFMYLAYDAPHAVLELPTQAYPEGKGLNGGLQYTGTHGHMLNTSSGTPDSYVYPEYANAVYDDDDPETKAVPWPDTYKRYATMVRRIDDGVGDILQLLKDLKIDDNTLVVFSSDNGASIESYLPKTYVPVKPVFFASNGPFVGIKRDCLEGGIRMPVLAQWTNHIKPGKVIETPSMLSDWLATFADAAGVQAPAKTDGVSLMPALTGKGTQAESLVYVEYFESGHTPNFETYVPAHRNRKRGEMQMIRKGDFVGVRYNIKTAEDDFEIYDIMADPQQANNLSAKSGFEKIQAQMKAKVLQLRRKDENAKRPYDDAPIPASVVTTKMRSGWAWSFYKGSFPWVASVYGLKRSAKGISKIAAGEKTKADGMTVYNGFIKIPADGVYSFALQTNGKAFVRLHEAKLLDADFGYQPGKKITHTVVLKAGYHPITIHYLQKGKVQPDMELKWKTSDKDWQPLQAESFYHSR